tara:strand:+ start:344 stop:790 length:447 start_codon:yes stop_codon:yes gene_type:complete
LEDHSEDHSEGHSEDLKVLWILQEEQMEGHLADHLEDLKVLWILREGRMGGHLADRLEGLLDLEPLQQTGCLEAQRGQGLLQEVLVFLAQVVQVLTARVLMVLRFHPLLRMLRRASSRVLPLQPVLVLVLQMFSCRPWSSLSTPYLAA